MRTVILSLTAAAALSASPAFAAAETGPYVGVAVTHDNISSTGDLEGIGTNGVGGSVFAGFNYSMSSAAFVGLEANFDLASAEIDALNVKADHAYGVSARAGYNVSPGAAIYGRVGYQRGRMTFDNDLPTETRVGADGLRLGGGIEANLTGNVGVRVEYNHTHYYVDTPAGIDAGVANNQATVGVVFGF